jgi:hypothetical protein
MKTILMATAAVAMLGMAACSQGTNEESGEAADTAYEESTTGSTDMGQGPQEEAGEAADEAQGEAAEGEPAPAAPTTP